jgi:hypothetical protein
LISLIILEGFKRDWVSGLWRFEWDACLSRLIVDRLAGTFWSA